VSTNEDEAGVSGQGTVIDSTHAAIVIGIAPSLKAAAVDPPEVIEARSMAEWLLAKDGGGVPRRSLQLITSSVGRDGTIVGPTLEQLENAFRALYDQRGPRPRPRRSLVENRLTIVATGPGYGERDGRVILQIANDPEQRGVGLELTSIADRFRDDRIFDEIVLIVDVPRFIGHQGTSKEMSFDLAAAGSPNKPASYFYAFSNQYGLRASPSSPRRLIPTLLSGLSGAAQNDRGVIDSRSLSAYAAEEYRAAGAETALMPEFRQGPDPIVFARSRTQGSYRDPARTSGSASITTETGGLSTEGGQPFDDEGAEPRPNPGGDIRIEPPGGEVATDSAPASTRIGAALEAARRLLGGGLKFVREAGEDELCLNVDDYANAVAQLYVNADEGEFSLAVFGPWGRGKTFLMRRVDLALRGLNRGYRTIRFSAWKYPSAPEVWVHLYEEFAKVAFEGPWYQVMPNVVRTGVVKHGPRALLWSYALFAFGLIPIGSLFGVAHAVVDFLYPIVGLIGFVLLLTIFAGVRRTKARLSHEYLTASRHTEKLGLQATIGSDLRALLMGWIPVRLVGRAFTFWYAVITAGLIAAVILRLAQGAELEYLAKAYFDLTLVGKARVGVEVGLVIMIAGLFWRLLRWLRNGGLSPKKVLLVVDDLDRCKPEHLLSVMESIKLLIEDPDVSSRVQVAMLLEEDILKHAIFEKYGHLTDKTRGSLLHTHYDANRLIWENGEKLFTAHLRLPVLAKSEVRDLIETFSERRRTEAEKQKKRAEREKRLEEDLAREQRREPLTHIQTGTKATEKESGPWVHAEPMGIERKEEPTYREATAEEIETDRRQHEERLRAIQDELQNIRNELEGEPTVAPPPAAEAATTSERVLEERETDAILTALDAQSGARTALGPRAIRAFIFRYQLARLLLTTLKIRWEPEVLATSLAQRSFGGTQETTPAPISADLTDEQKLQRVVDQVY
jgi:hypothetical protein